jgi:hypothetical protein
LKEKAVKVRTAIVCLLLLALAVSITNRVFAQAERGRPPAAEPPMLGLHWARGHAPASPGQGAGSPNLVYHNGSIMTNVVVRAIFWGTSWSNASFVQDKISGLTGPGSFYGDSAPNSLSGVGGSPYARTSDEYYGPIGTIVGDVITNGTPVIDPSAVSKNVSRITTPTLNEVCKVISNPVANGYYPVYVDTPRGGAGFCAWHSYGTCNNVPVQFAFFFNLDNDPGCDPQDTSGLHSQGLAALANVSGHELSEARTDPRNGGWYDSSGQENADKCAWTFGTSLLTFTNNSQWKVQGNWSNAAYNANSGYGPRGCIDAK